LNGEFCGMAQSSRIPSEIRTERETVSLQNQEPIRTFERSAININQSLYANLPMLARDQLGVERKTRISVEVFSDRVVVRRATDE